MQPSQRALTSTIRQSCFVFVFLIFVRSLVLVCTAEERDINSYWQMLGCFNVDDALFIIFDGTVINVLSGRWNTSLFCINSEHSYQFGYYIDRRITFSIQWGSQLLTNTRFIVNFSNKIGIFLNSCKLKLTRWGKSDITESVKKFKSEEIVNATWSRQSSTKPLWVLYHSVDCLYFRKEFYGKFFDGKLLIPVDPISGKIYYESTLYKYLKMVFLKQIIKELSKYSDHYNYPTKHILRIPNHSWKNTCGGIVVWYIRAVNL